MTEGPWSIADENAEESVLGGVLVHPRVFDDVVIELEAVDFYDGRRGAIFEAMLALDRAQAPIDAITVWQQMGTSGTDVKLRGLGGSEYLSHLMSEVVTVENIGFHARIVANLAERRRINGMLQRLLVESRDRSIEHPDFVRGLEAALLELGQARRGETTLMDSKAGMNAFLTELEQRVDERDKPTKRGIPIHVPSFDYHSSGLHPGQLMTIAARSGIGKTTLLTDILGKTALSGIPTLLFSLEQTQIEIFEKLIALSGVATNNLRTGYLAADEFVKIHETAGRYADPPRLYVDAPPEMSITELRSKARRWRARQGAGVRALVAVDFLQLVKPSTKRPNFTREQEVAEVARGLKTMAKELECPVIALAQLTREVDKRTDQRPVLADLRESGEIEIASDIVAFLYRSDQNPKCLEDEKNDAELIVRKGRGMQRINAKLTWNAKYTRYENRKDEAA